MSCCCSDSSCSWEPIRSRNVIRGETATGDVRRLVDEDNQTESTEERSRMDIALLREQYRCTREKQKRQTQVVLFRQAPVVETDGCSMVSVVPFSHGSGEDSPERWGLPNQDSQPPSSVHMEKGPWHSHLGMHRRTCLVNNAPMPQTTFNPSCPSVVSSTPCSSPSPLSEGQSRGSAGELTPSGASTSGSSEELDSGVSGGSSRKSSAPAVLSRQLSFGSHHSRGGGAHPLGPSSSSPHHYPFPQRKTLTKSEAAKRLGLYSSF
ncbi:uncharacterized protein C9orf152-like [Hypomesus transpacificus]|uniref:uncharacterized protein C9orf152-like n=1 Tax=Hypomesus transpacificus TaxID=137520 RepID=UPI001F07863B|nr:uncharacterized protein C9orf152-like [Hypomesus transpacificus]XP_046880352.1 uncharacterized protein C9orf152-like [Hypomesus transpacificus]XP_046880353.1 uncharacterized protein C9orf152-like [Hypomesus transpacificus]XP_046880354.1 uncharacterized protein C9orf152-like [Hypomesus transpacificus]